MWQVASSEAAIMSISSWSPLCTLFSSSSTSFALLLLNREVERPELLFNLWNAAHLKVTVDGGTTVWQNLLDKYGFKVNLVEMSWNISLI